MKLISNNLMPRFLRTFSKTRPEVIIANNSGLFFTYASIIQHGRHAHPDIKLIVPEFWLDNVHGDYHNLDWGQNLRGLPWFVREEFYKIYPNHEESKYITWGQFKELRSYIKNEIHRMGIEIFTGIPNIRKNKQEGYSVTMNEGVFNCTDNTHFYNSFRLFKLDHSLGEQFIKRSHTFAYHYPRSLSPNSFILIGGGRSAIWLANHFQDKLVMCILNKEERELPLFKNEEAPSNLFIMLNSDFEKQNGYKLRPTSENGSFVNVYTQKDGEETSTIFGGEFCVAIGLRTAPEVTQEVSDSNKTIMAEKYLPWYSAQEVPVGSLVESTLRWAAITENLDWSYEVYGFHHSNIVDALNNILEKKDIILPLSFFDNLKNEIGLSNSKTPSMIVVPSRDVLIEKYKKACRDAFNGNVHSDVINSLESALFEIEKNRADEFLSKKNSSGVIIPPRPTW